MIMVLMYRFKHKHFRLARCHKRKSDLRTPSDQRTLSLRVTNLLGQLEILTDLLQRFLHASALIQPPR